MQVNISNCHRSNREHLVYYVVRDHFSGNLFFRLASTRSLLPVPDFLYEAWSEEGGDGHFWGLPDALSVPALLSTQKLEAGLARLGVEVVRPASGFASGVRVIRDVEDQIHVILGRTVDHRLEALIARRQDFYQYLLNLYSIENRVVKWRKNLPPGHPKQVPDREAFLRCFALPAGKKRGPAEEEGRADAARPTAQAGNVLEDPITKHPFSLEKLRRAQDLMYHAWDTEGRSRRMGLAYQALKISPYCADAYNLLAGESSILEEKLRLYEKGVQAGRLALGDLFFRQNAGYFWSLIETRPFMRALGGLAECLWRAGRRAESIAAWKEMLRLNPRDNQGIRYVLVNRLLEEDRDQECRRLLADNEGDISCIMRYSEALLAFRESGAGGRADECLRRAIEANGYVPAYLLGEKALPFRLPDYYGIGDEREAVICATYARPAWRKTPGALEWLRRLST